MKPVSRGDGLSHVLTNYPATSRPTIVDVARRCGLSKATVSKVLNLPVDECPIAEPTRQRVFTAVEELGYRPSWQGRMLANRRTGMIAVVNADPYGAVPRGQYWGMVEHFDSLLAEAGLVPVFIHTYEGNPRAIEMLADQRFDGCVSLDAQPPEVLQQLRRSGTPTVMINADVDDSWTSLSFDDQRGTELLVKHLIDLGHRRIAYNAGRRVVTHSNGVVRAATYARCMYEAGLEPCEPFTGPVADFVDHALHGPYKPTAILDFEHWTAVRVLQQLWRAGVRVPSDMSVVTFNETYPVDLVIPPLTVAAIDVKDVSIKTVQWLTQLLDEPHRPVRHELVDSFLVVRESAAAPPSA